MREYSACLSNSTLFFFSFFYVFWLFDAIVNFYVYDEIKALRFIEKTLDISLESIQKISLLF